MVYACAARVGRLVVGGLAAVWFVSAADAGVTLSHEWVEVDNSTTSADGMPSGLDDGSFDGSVYRTFDLFVLTETPVLVADSAVTQSSGPNPGLQIDNTGFFNRQFFDADVDLPASASQIDFDPLLEYDSHVGLGGLAADEILVASDIQFGDSGVSGNWSVQGGADPVAPIDGRVFVGRFTVESLTGFMTDESADRSLAGTLFVFPEGAGQGTVIEISNAFVPTPGAAGVLVVAGLAFARRRRGALRDTSAGS